MDSKAPEATCAAATPLWSAPPWWRFRQATCRRVTGGINDIPKPLNAARLDRRVGQAAKAERCLRSPYPLVAARSCWLVGEIVLGLARFVALLVIWRGVPGRDARARWLQQVCRRALRVFGINLSIDGPIPSEGLLVSNHLSYLDILLLGAMAPCVFVSKSEVRAWPVFGWFASLAGTIFVRRARRSDVGRTNREMRRVIEDDGLVVLFPEGTTSDGRHVLPFRSALLQATAQRRDAITAALIHYSLPNGNVAEEVCYWRDMTLVPHLFNLLGKRRLKGIIRFTRVQHNCSDRKQLARQLHAEVTRLKQLCSVTDDWRARFSLSPRGTSGERAGERGSHQDIPPLPGPLLPPASGREGETSSICRGYGAQRAR